MDVSNLRCPECGREVFVTTLSPEGWVMCRDMGHWVGPASACTRLTTTAPDPAILAQFTDEQIHDEECRRRYKFEKPAAEQAQDV